MNPEDSQTFPDWKLEQFLLDELSEQEMEAVRRAAERDDGLRKRLEAMTRSNEEILREYPADWMGRRIREKLDAATPVARSRRYWRVLAPAGVAAALLLAVFALPDLIPVGDQPGREVTRLKGESPQLRVHRKTATGSEPLQERDRASAGDVIRLQYQTDDLPFVAILSVDGRGTITRHLPPGGDDAVEVELMQPHFLDHAYELDDAPYWEVFFVVTAPSPFPVGSVVRAIETSLSSAPEGAAPGRAEPPQALELPDDFRVARFILLKDRGNEKE